MISSGIFRTDFQHVIFIIFLPQQASSGNEDALRQKYHLFKS